MREIVKPNGEVYCYVSVDSGQLRIKLNNGPGKGKVVCLDDKIIPQLRQILAEAEFLKIV